MVWVLRVLVWAVLLIVGYRGVTAIVLNETPASRAGAPAAPPASVQFPVTLAEAYAMQFGQVYLNFSPATADQRAQQLGAFLPAAVSGANSELGWNGVGQLRLQSEQVAGINVTDSRHAVVTLLASVNGKLMELGVPVYASGGGITVSGEPAWLAAPAQISPPVSAARSSDPAATSALMAQLPDFFRAYASGDSAALNRFLAPGVSVNGLGGTVTFSSIASLDVSAGGTTRQVTAAVSWQLAGQAGLSAASLEVTYDLTVVEQGGRWYVAGIRASTQTAGGS
jgi:hypothetical protein